MQAETPHQLVPENVTSPTCVANRGHPSHEHITLSLLRISQKDCNDTRNRFIPRKALIEFFDLERVERLLQIILGPCGKDSNDWRDVAKRICPGPEDCSCRFPSCTGGRMTLATLFLCGKEDLVLSFFSTSDPTFCDGKLPLRFETPDDPDYGLNDEDRELFTHSQWNVYTPFLTRFVSGKKEDIETFPDEVSLPCKRKERIGEHAAAELSFVELVEIDPNNHEFPRQDNNTFALKTFEPRLDDELAEDGFHQEVEANLDAPKHDRIVRLLTAFRYRKRFYILFSFATEGNLEDFWKSHHPNGINEESMPTTSTIRYSDQWLVGQCHRLTEALVATHGLAEGQPEGTRSLLHLDIKPENILCFRDPDIEEPGVVLKLADFGEAERFESNVSLQASKVAHVKTYRPPEKYDGNIITPTYDVWCLGCLFLEFVTWLIRGQDGIESFSTTRAEEPNDRALTKLVEDTFFKRIREKPGPSSIKTLRMGHERKMKQVSSGQATTRHFLWVASHVKVTSQLKDGVILHLRSLQADAKCSDKLRQLLSFVEEKMLVVEPEKRANSPEVYEFLTRLENS